MLVAKGESRGVDLMSGNLFLPPREVYSMTPEDRTLDTSLGLLGFTDLLEPNSQDLGSLDLEMGPGGAHLPPGGVDSFLETAWLLRNSPGGHGK